jgi:hypothetical protein
MGICLSWEFLDASSFIDRAMAKALGVVQPSLSDPVERQPRQQPGTPHDGVAVVQVLELAQAPLRPADRGGQAGGVLGDPRVLVEEPTLGDSIPCG